MELSKLIEKHTNLKEEVVGEDYVATFIQKDFTDAFYSSDVRAAILYYQITGKEMNHAVTPLVEQVVRYLPFSLGGHTSAIEKILYLDNVLSELKVKTLMKGLSLEPVDNTRHIERQLTKINKLQKPVASYIYNNVLTDTARAILEEAKEVNEIEFNFSGEGFYSKCILNPNQLRALFLTYASNLKDKNVQLNDSHIAALLDYVEKNIKNVVEPIGEWSLEQLNIELYKERFSTGPSKETKAKLLHSLKLAVEWDNYNDMKYIAEMYQSIHNINFYK